MHAKRLMGILALGLGLTLALLAGLQTSRASPATLYVTHDCTGIANCYTSIQAAVDAAVVGEEIHVATGTFTGVQQRATITQVVYISKSVTIRGGYSAGFSAWDPDTYFTTLDAGGQGRVVYIGGNVTPTLEGLRLTNGAATAGDPSEPIGGGIAAYSAHPVISGCHIFSNTGNVGGGVFLNSSQRAMLIDNDIFSNSATYNGGGIALYFIGNSTLANNRIYSNTAGIFGGGIIVADAGYVRLEGNSILSNTAANSGGGITLMRSANALVLGNEIRGNTTSAGGGGGGIYLSSNPTTTLINNIVAQNRVGTGAGAGIYVWGSEGCLLHTTIVRNTGGDGSGIHVTGYIPGGGSLPYRSGIIAMTNTILVSHSVGIMVTANNTATLESTLWGEGIWANKTPRSGSGTIYTGTDVFGAPAFVNPDGSDYHIGPGSAALDTGVEAGVADDIDGDARPIGSRPDLGADEAWRWVFLPLVLRNY